MEASINHKGLHMKVDLSKGLDISIAVRGDSKCVEAWIQETPIIDAIKMGSWEGKVSKGASVNFNRISFSPHSHGTHTESFGHISPENHHLNSSLKNFFFLARLISITPKETGSDKVIEKKQVESFLSGDEEALIIRTLPNSIAKRSAKYHGTNWPYLSEETAVFLRERNVDHLLIDTPSVDKEDDGGQLLAHKAFWNYPKQKRLHATITELVYVPAMIEDGLYLLNLQTASIENDAAPSRPVLFKILKA